MNLLLLIFSYKYGSWDCKHTRPGGPTGIINAESRPVRSHGKPGNLTSGLRGHQEPISQLGLHIARIPYWSWNADLKTNFLFKNFYVFNWRIIALQHCVGFCETSRWISHEHMYVFSSWASLPPPPRPLLIPLGCQRAWSWAPWVLQWILTGDLFYMWRYVCFSATFSICLNPSFPQLCPQVCFLPLYLHVCKFLDASPMKEVGLWPLPCIDTMVLCDFHE